jgi:16S rRNA (cytidine1402-2'-O)-methyltransferase
MPVQDGDAPDHRPPSYMVGGAEIVARPLEPGLYVVATPIGNLGDVTLRALETMAAADILACEDTRVTRTLLQRYGIARRPFAYHEHNHDVAGARILQALHDGRSVALVSDAGTPLVSDPGSRLVASALEAGYRVVPIPGASAMLAALAAAGLPTDTFLFAGFLPAKSGQRDQRLAELASVPATLVFYESPHRTADTLTAMAARFGPTRQGAVARELTKAFEEIRRGGLAGLAAHYDESPPRGEVVLLVSPPDAAADRLEDSDVDALLLDLARELPVSRAAAEASKRTGRRKPELYKRLLALRGEGDA